MAEFNVRQHSQSSPTVSTTHYVTYYNLNGNAKFPRGWYAFQATVSSEGKIVVHRNTYNYSKRSRGEAVEKLFRTRIGLTRNQEHHHIGVESLDYKFDPNKFLAA